jgi:uncharacterized protein (DUF342 family)
VAGNEGDEKEAKIAFEVGDDGSTIERIWPESDPVEIPTLEAATERLIDLQAGSIDMEALEASLVPPASPEAPVEPMVVAVRDPDGKAIWLRPEGWAVAKDELIAYTGPGHPNLTTTDEVVPTPEGTDRIAYRARRSGIVRLDEGSVTIEPFLRIGPNYQHARLEAPSGTLGLTTRLVLDHLASVGVVHGIDEEEIDRVVFELAEGEEGIEAEVAAGTPAINGRDSRLLLDVKTDLHSGKIDEGGSIDYWSRGWEDMMVRVGDKIAEILPPDPGVEGTDLLGRTIPVSIEGRTIDYRAHSGVTFLEAEQRFEAEIAGQVYLHENALTVFPTIEVEGDVNFNTGNIDAKEKAIHVRGNIRASFSVEADGPIVIDGIIEDCRVVSRNSFISAGGIIHRKFGSIAAKEGVTTAYAHNARIRCGGDLRAPRGLVQCSVECAGSIWVVGENGRIVGGQASANEKIVTNVAGSQANVPTRLVIGSAAESERQRSLRRREIARLLKPLKRRFGVRWDMIDPRTLPKADREDYNIMVLLIEEEESLSEPEARRKTRSDGNLVIRDTIYPGCALYIGKNFLRIKEALKAILYESELLGIVERSIDPNDPKYREPS